MLDVTLLRPWWLLAFFPMMLLVLCMYRAKQHQENAWQKAFDPHLLKHFLLSIDKKKHNLALFLSLLASLCCSIALSGPAVLRSLPVIEEKLPYVMVIDLASHMNVSDIMPSRWQRAIYKARDFSQSIKGSPQALIAFSKAPFVVCPLTLDQKSLDHLLSLLNPTLMPEDGFDLALALKKAGQLLTAAHFQSGHILLLTAGKPDAESFKMAKQLKNKGIHLSVLGMGTLDNTPVKNQQGHFVFQHNGSILTTALHPHAYAKLANAGGGNWAMFHGDDRDIEQIINGLGFMMQDNKHLTNQWKASQFQEISSWFACFAALALLAVFRRGVL
jgi:Ca-activated chloride channel homolog